MPVLALLVAVQLLLLPVNHGVLTAGRGVPRLKSLPQEEAGSRVWRVWQGAASSVCLVERPGTPVVRRLVEGGLVS